MAEYLERDVILKAFKLIAKNSDKRYEKGMQDAIDWLIPRVIADIPVAEVQPVKHGKWEQGKCTNCEKRLEDLFEGDFAPQWISVEERLPNKFDYVLCYCKTTTGEGNDFMFGAYHNDTWWLKTCRTYATLEQPQMRVMYWMPLPEPPRMDKEN